MEFVVLGGFGILFILMADRLSWLVPEGKSAGTLAGRDSLQLCYVRLTPGQVYGERQPLPPFLVAPVSFGEEVFAPLDGLLPHLEDSEVTEASLLPSCPSSSVTAAGEVPTSLSKATRDVLSAMEDGQDPRVIPSQQGNLTILISTRAEDWDAIWQSGGPLEDFHRNKHQFLSFLRCVNSPGLIQYILTSQVNHLCTSYVSEDGSQFDPWLEQFIRFIVSWLRKHPQSEANNPLNLLSAKGLKEWVSKHILAKNIPERQAKPIFLLFQKNCSECDRGF